jgi:hypothetical protein
MGGNCPTQNSGTSGMQNLMATSQHTNGFETLMPSSLSLERHLLTSKGMESTQQRILHLGSGDSVSALPSCPRCLGTQLAINSSTTNLSQDYPIQSIGARLHEPTVCRLFHRGSREHGTQTNRRSPGMSAMCATWPVSRASLSTSLSTRALWML